MHVQEDVHWKPLLNRALQDFKIDFKWFHYALSKCFRATSNDEKNILGFEVGGGYIFQHPD